MKLDNLDLSTQAKRDLFLSEITADYVSNVDNIQADFFQPNAYTGLTGLELLIIKLKQTSLTPECTLEHKQAFSESIFENVMKPMFAHLCLPISDKPQGMHAFLQMTIRSNLPELTEMGLLTAITQIQTLDQNTQLSALLQKDPKTKLSLLQKMLHYMTALADDTKTAALNKLWNELLQPKATNTNLNNAEFFNELNIIDFSVIELLMETSPSFRAFVLTEHPILVDGKIIQITDFEQHILPKISVPLNAEKWAVILTHINHDYPTQFERIVPHLFEATWNQLKDKDSKKLNKSSYDDGSQAATKQLQHPIFNFLDCLYKHDPTTFTKTMAFSVTSNQKDRLTSIIEKIIYNADSNSRRPDYDDEKSRYETALFQLFKQISPLVKSYKTLEKMQAHLFSYFSSPSELKFMNLNNLQDTYSLCINLEQKAQLLCKYGENLYRNTAIVNEPQLSRALAVALCEVKLADLIKIRGLDPKKLSNYCFSYGFLRLRQTKNNQGYRQFAADLENIEATYASAEGSIGEWLNGDKNVGYFSKTETRKRLDKLITAKKPASEYPVMWENNGVSSAVVEPSAPPLPLPLPPPLPQHDALTETKEQAKEEQHNLQYNNNSHSAYAQGENPSSATAPVVYAVAVAVPIGNNTNISWNNNNLPPVLTTAINILPNVPTNTPVRVPQRNLQKY